MLLSAFLNSPGDFLWNIVNLIYPIFSLRVLYFTLFILMIALVMVKGLGSAHPFLQTFIVIFVPGFPLIILTASIRLISGVKGFPLISTIMSPALSPALYAGVSSMGAIIMSFPSFVFVICIPSPPNSPLVST